MTDDLLERRIRERVELELDHGNEPVHRHADRSADDGRLSQRCVEAALLAEALLQTVGDAEHPAQSTDVLTVDDHPVVGPERVVERSVEGLRERHRLDARGRRGLPARRERVGGGAGSVRVVMRGPVFGRALRRDAAAGEQAPAAAMRTRG